MVYVRLAQEWTDSSGTAYAAGAMVDVDAATLAGLEARGVVAEAAPSPRPGTQPDGDDTDGIPEPGDDDDPDGIPEPGGAGTRRGASPTGIPEPG